MYKSILLSVDLQDEASWKKALPTALAMGKTFGAQVHLITVVPELPAYVVGTFLPGDTETKLVQAARDNLKAFAAEHGDGTEIVPHVAMGSVYSSILEAARSVGADLIVMASHRPEMSDYLLGPNAARVVRHSACSVLVVRD
ncbi:MAG: universal stress protein [Hyphomicrobiales bacterium]|nr:universal stress protein [Hyphomicrobiales bacterium]